MLGWDRSSVVGVVVVAVVVVVLRCRCGDRRHCDLLLRQPTREQKVGGIHGIAAEHVVIVARKMVMIAALVLLGCSCGC